MHHNCVFHTARANGHILRLLVAAIAVVMVLSAAEPAQARVLLPPAAPSSSMRLVGTSPVTVTVESSSNSSVYGQTVWFTATVSAEPPEAGTPTGTVQFWADGSLDLGSETLSAGGSASISTTGLAVGTHAITAEYSGDSNFSTGSSDSVSQTVNKANTTTTIVSSAPNPSQVGQAVTMAYTVVVDAPGGGTPTGNVTVTDGTTTCIGTVAEGQCEIVFTSAGSKTLHATYTGNSNFNGSASPDATQTVHPAGTTTALASSTNSSVFGQTVWFTATVSVTSPGSGSPTGTVQFWADGSLDLGSETLSAGGSASTSTSSLPVGNHTITAVYSGDDNFETSTGTLVNQGVAIASTTTSIATGPSPSVFGETVWFTATVSAEPPEAGTPTGTVQFWAEGTAIGSPAALSNGSASISTTGLAVGTHAITAVYGGDGDFGGSTSDPVSQTVNKASTTTTIGSRTPNPSQVGQAVTINFTVVANAPGAGVPTGNVTVTDGTGPSCTGTVAVGSCQIVFTSPGTKTLTASFGGDSSFGASTSPSVSHLVRRNVLYLPFVGKSPWRPRPGAWQSATNDEFNVSPGGGSIEDFSIYIDIPSCGISHYKITHTIIEPIVNYHFAFTGSFYADVTFDSETTAHGIDGLNDFTVAGCGTNSAGPWPFTATWQSNAPLSFSGARSPASPNSVESISGSGRSAHTVGPK